MKTETVNWIPKEGERIYYTSQDGSTIPGVIETIYWQRMNEVRDFPPLVKVRLNHPDYIQDVCRIVSYKKLRPQE